MRRTSCLLAVAASVAITFGASGVAFAQPASAPNPEAVRHFLEGKRLRDEGRCDLAIRELKESVDKEPSIGAHYNLGVCYEKTNKKAALANYQAAEEIAKKKNDDRLREIRAQRADFLARTTHLRLALPQPLPPDIKVAIDGDPIPSEELQGETIYFPPNEQKSYEVRVTAPGYDDLKITIDSSTVQKNMLVTIAPKKTVEGPVGQPGLRPPPETKWGGFQFLGLGLIAVGAVGVTYGAVGFISYSAEEDNLLKNFRDAENVAKDCPSSSSPETTCGKNIATRERLRDEYNANEADAQSSKGLWLTAGIGGALAILGGAALIIWGPRAEAGPESGAAKAAPPTKIRFVPTYTLREQGLSIVGTF